MGLWQEALHLCYRGLRENGKRVSRDSTCLGLRGLARLAKAEQANRPRQTAGAPEFRTRVPLLRSEIAQRERERERRAEEPDSYRLLRDLERRCAEEPGRSELRVLRIVALPDVLQGIYKNIKFSPLAIDDKTVPADPRYQFFQELSEKFLDNEKFKWEPASIEQVLRSDGKQKYASAQPTMRDSILLEAMGRALDAVFDPMMSKSSHGFRIGRSCHSALSQVQTRFRGVRWVVVADLKRPFQDCTKKRTVLARNVNRQIKDVKFNNRLVAALKVGYADPSKAGFDQAGHRHNLSTRMTNIYLHHLDEWAANYDEKCERALPGVRNNGDGEEDGDYDGDDDEGEDDDYDDEEDAGDNDSDDDDDDDGYVSDEDGNDDDGDDLSDSDSDSGFDAEFARAGRQPPSTSSSRSSSARNSGATPPGSAKQHSKNSAAPSGSTSSSSHTTKGSAKLGIQAGDTPPQAALPGAPRVGYNNSEAGPWEGDCGKSGYHSTKTSVFEGTEYVRYGTNLIMGVRGAKPDAAGLAADLREFLRREMNLELQDYDFYVKNAVDPRHREYAEFLGMEVCIVPALKRNWSRPGVRRRGYRLSELGPLICQLRMPGNNVMRAMRAYDFVKGDFKNARAHAVGFMIHWQPDQIVRAFSRYGTRLCDYYAPVANFRSLKYLHLLLKTAAQATLGRKHKLRSIRKVYKKFGRHVEVKDDGGRSLSSLRGPSFKDYEPHFTGANFNPYVVPWMTRQAQDVLEEMRRRPRTVVDKKAQKKANIEGRKQRKLDRLESQQEELIRTAELLGLPPPPPAKVTVRAAA